VPAKLIDILWSTFFWGVMSLHWVIDSRPFEKNILVLTSRVEVTKKILCGFPHQLQVKEDKVSSTKGIYNSDVYILLCPRSSCASGNLMNVSPVTPFHCQRIAVNVTTFRSTFVSISYNMLPYLLYWILFCPTFVSYYFISMWHELRGQ